MSSKRRLLNSMPAMILALWLLMPATDSVAASQEMADLLPQPACAAGWKIDSTSQFYDRETLSDRINGEAELYFPYGFDRMAAARYRSAKNPDIGLDVEIYRMGSLLDAYGMYANYRQQQGSTASAGTESNLSPPQLFLYQGQYFVHLQITGTDTIETGSLTECAQMVASRLPVARTRPAELAAFDRPEVVKGTERYLPQSLLGYDFLNRGIMVDARLEGNDLQVFLLLGNTPASATTAFNRFRDQLSQGTVDQQGFLSGVDPLYGPVIVLKKGGCLAGALKFKNIKGSRALLEGICTAAK
jgi:hypothetical protein